MSPALIVFDWDGTLADSHAKIVGCFEATIATLGAVPKRQDELRRVIGLGLPQTASALFPASSSAFVEQFVAAYRDHWLAPGAPPARLFDGARECVTALQARGIDLAVATGKSRAGLDRELGETLLTDAFVATRCADETRSKPHPQMLLELLDVTGVAPSRALVIGDTTFDLEMAQAAAVPSVAVSYGAHDAGELRACGPEVLLGDIDELVSWLDGQVPSGTT